jgi:hypothetical protein
MGAKIRKYFIEIQTASETKQHCFLLYFHIQAILPAKHLNNGYFGYSKIQERTAGGTVGAATLCL